MKFKNLFLFLILLVFVIGCVPQQQAKIQTPSAEKINPNQTNQQTKAPETEAEKITPEIKQTVRDDFGCWPPSCSVITYPEDQKCCEDWKAGK